MKLHYEKRNEVIDKPKTIKFSDKEIALIEKFAKEENRTFSNFVRTAIAFYIRNRMKQISIFPDTI
jgi:hypothetical protein